MKGPLTPAKMLTTSLLAATVQFGLAIMLLGGWTAFFSHPALMALAAATLGLLLIIVVALGFDYTNGFHDSANAIATSVSTKALTPRAALLLEAHSRGWPDVQERVALVADDGDGLLHLARDIGQRLVLRLADRAVGGGKPTGVKGNPIAPAWVKESIAESSRG